MNIRPENVAANSVNLIHYTSPQGHCYLANQIAFNLFVLITNYNPLDMLIIRLNNIRLD